MLDKGANDTGRTLRAQRQRGRTVLQLKRVHLFIDHITGVISTLEYIGVLKDRRTDLFVIVDVTKLTDQFFQAMPFADLLR